MTDIHIVYDHDMFLLLAGRPERIVLQSSNHQNEHACALAHMYCAGVLRLLSKGVSVAGISVGPGFAMISKHPVLEQISGTSEGQSPISLALSDSFLYGCPKVRISKYEWSANRHHLLQDARSRIDSLAAELGIRQDQVRFEDAELKQLFLR